VAGRVIDSYLNYPFSDFLQEHGDVVSAGFSLSLQTGD